jgi:hypothetical protein
MAFLLNRKKNPGYEEELLLFACVGQRTNEVAAHFTTGQYKGEGRLRNACPPAAAAYPIPNLRTAAVELTQMSKLHI